MKKHGNNIRIENFTHKMYNAPVNKGLERGMCMKGRIYPTRDGFIVRFGRDISKWFKHEVEAERFLIGLRYETDKGTFDPRDYKGDKPLAFCNLADK